MTAPDLDALEKLADEATPGPWITETGMETVWVGSSKANAAKVARIICPVDVGPGYTTEYVEQQTANAAFIAAANPATIKALIAELKEARRLLKPFAAAAEKLDGLWDESDWRWNDSVRSNVTVRDIRAVSAFLAPNGKGEG